MKSVEMKKYIAEMIGTFALVFCGTGAIIINEQTAGEVSPFGIAVTFGLIVMAMIYSIGNISGAHINPAVTIAFAVSKKFPKKQVIHYIAFQLAGALLASIILKFLFPENVMLGATSPHGTAMQSFILEIILTFFLMFVILCVSSGSNEKGLMAGIAIGGFVLLAAAFAGPISGASMNPARSLAPALVSGQLESLWIYLLAPIIGAILALVGYNAIKSD